MALAEIVLRLPETVAGGVCGVLIVVYVVLGIADLEVDILQIGAGLIELSLAVDDVILDGFELGGGGGDELPDVRDFFLQRLEGVLRGGQVGIGLIEGGLGVGLCGGGGDHVRIGGEIGFKLRPQGFEGGGSDSQVVFGGRCLGIGVDGAGLEGFESVFGFDPFGAGRGDAGIGGIAEVFDVKLIGLDGGLGCFEVGGLSQGVQHGGGCILKIRGGGIDLGLGGAELIGRLVSGLEAAMHFK